LDNIKASKYPAFSELIKPTVISCEETYVSHVKLMLTVTEAFPFVRKYTKMSLMSDLGEIVPKLSLRM